MFNKTKKPQFSTATPANCYTLLRSSKEGLSVAEAHSRLQDVLRGLSPEKKPLLICRIDPLLISGLLLGLALVAFNITAAGLVLLGCVATCASLYIFLPELRQKVKPRLPHWTVKKVSVLRGGKMRRIPVESVVAGDVFSIRVGDPIPADARLLTARELTIQAPHGTLAKKASALLHQPESLRTMVFAGDSVTSGNGTAIATVACLESKALSELRRGRTPYRSISTDLLLLGKKWAFWLASSYVLVTALGMYAPLDLHQYWLLASIPISSRLLLTLPFRKRGYRVETLQAVLDWLFSARLAFLFVFITLNAFLRVPSPAFPLLLGLLEVGAVLAILTAKPKNVPPVPLYASLTGATTSFFALFLLTETSPRFVDPTLPLFASAATIATLSLALIFALDFWRSWTAAFCLVSPVIAAAAIPSVKTVFHAGLPDLRGLVALGIGLGTTAALTALSQFLQRNNRQAVLGLYHELFHER